MKLFEDSLMTCHGFVLYITEFVIPKTGKEHELSKLFDSLVLI